MDIPKTLFATLVKQGRMEMHLTQEALAEKLGISAAYLGDLERHKGGPSLELFCKTMQTLNISADDYVYPNQNKNNSTYDQILRLDVYKRQFHDRPDIFRNRFILLCNCII